MYRQSKKSKVDCHSPSCSNNNNHEVSVGTSFVNETTSNFHTNVLDLANTLSQIMILCGIDECKAAAATDTSIYALLYCNRECYNCKVGSKMRIRMEDICHALCTKCFMNGLEAYLAYKIIEDGFKAFYTKPRKEGTGNVCEQCPYMKAARKTTQAFTRLEGLSFKEQHFCQIQIEDAYTGFIDRMKKRKMQSLKESCECCPSKDELEELELEEKKSVQVQRCPKCCNLLKSEPRPKNSKAKPKCQNSKKPCICNRSPFGLKWVKSIWERPDMNAYYKEKILNLHKSTGDPCNEWPDPIWLKLVAGEMYPEEADSDKYCYEWYDPTWMKCTDGISRTTKEDCYDPASLKPLQDSEI